MSDEYSIKIKTEGDPSGANNVATALKKVGKESGEAASFVEALGEKGSSAKDVYEGLSMTLNGGTGAVFGLAKAWQNLSAAMAANPFGAVAAAALALYPLIASLREKFSGTATAAKDLGAAADEAGGRLGALATAAGKLGEGAAQGKGSALDAQLNAIEQAADRALTKLRAIAQIRDELSNEKMALEIARVKAGSGTDLEKAEAIYGIRERYADQTSANRITGLQAEQSIAKEAAGKEQRAYESADQNLTREKSRLNELTRQQAERAALEAQIAKDQTTIDSQGSYANPETGAIPAQIMAEAEEAEKRQAAARQQLAKLPTQDELVNGIADAIATVQTLTTRVAAAGRQAVAARAKADDTEESTNRQIAAERAKRPIRKELGKLEAEDEFGAAKKRDEARANDEANRERQALGALGNNIKENLGGAAFSPERFSSRGYYSRDLMERDRAAVAERNARREPEVSAGLQKARELAGKLGDGKDDATEAKELNRILTRIGDRLDATTRNNISPLVIALRDFESRLAANERKLGNLDSVVRAKRQP